MQDEWIFCKWLSIIALSVFVFIDLSIFAEWVNLLWTRFWRCVRRRWQRGMDSNSINSLYSLFLLEFIKPRNFKIPYHPHFQIGAYNSAVSEDFQLPFEPNTLAVLLISSPKMFDVSFAKWIREKLEKVCWRFFIRNLNNLDFFQNFLNRYF